MGAKIYAMMAVAAMILVSVSAVAFLYQDESTDGSDEMTETIMTPGTYEREVKAGEEFTIALNSNPTTGYDWIIVSADGLEKTGDRYEVEPGKENLCGAGGIQYFTFKCDSQGEYRIVLDYCRAWEGSCGNIVNIDVKVV